MKKYYINQFRKYSFLALFSFLVLLFVASCKEDKAQVVDSQQNVGKKTYLDKELNRGYSESASEKTSKNMDTISDLFKDSAAIEPKNKYMIIIFGTNTDPFTTKMKNDIESSTIFQSRLKNDFTSYYLKTHENLKHKLFHENEFMDVDTKTMISVYGVTGTPTIIFSDKKSKAILMVPGYMPLDQFLATMDFIESKKWVGKDRKNGEVYEELKNFYIKKGILNQK